MPRKHRGIAAERRQLVQAPKHLIDVSAGEVGASAPVQEQGVAGDQSAVEEEALAARRMARGVQQLDVDGTDIHLVAIAVFGEIAHRDPGDPGNPLRFMSIDVHGHADPLQQFGEALEFEAHHRSADVIGVVMGDQHSGQFHPVGFEGVE